MVSLIENFNTLVIAEVKNQQQEILTSFVAELLKNPALQENEEEIISLKEQFIQKLQLNKSDKPNKYKRKTTTNTETNKKRKKPTPFTVIVSHYKTMDFQEKFKELLLTEEEKDDAGINGRGHHFKLCKFILEKINESPKHKKKLQKMIEQEMNVFNAQQEKDNADSDSTSTSKCEYSKQYNAEDSDSDEQNNAEDCDSDYTYMTVNDSDEEN
jgi:hypothetical protein